MLKTQSTGFQVLIFKFGSVKWLKRLSMGMSSSVGSLIDNSIGNLMGQCKKVKITNVFILHLLLKGILFIDLNMNKIETGSISLICRRLPPSPR